MRADLVVRSCLMCNLYKPAPGAIEQIVSNARTLFDVPGFDKDKVVAPFAPGVFVKPGVGGLVGVVGQWGLIRHGQPTRIEYLHPKTGRPLPADAPIKGKARSTNNARTEDIDKKVTFKKAWRTGQRCIIPVAWYQEPNWETLKHIPWQLRRADGAPWALAGLWDEWADPSTGEMVPNYTMLTMNCTGHTLLGRLHRPDVDPKTKQPLPADQQDKRSVIQIDPADWDQWLYGTETEARVLLRLQPPEVFDQADAQRTDEALAALAASKAQVNANQSLF